ncbi:CBS domain-containing protein [Youngiibacter fragilis]|uniref:Inosine-5-monophosphate dehydrogenase n=1 Tax=Youngiibacter fragilis 232.1 TaxID=994573 RepID=V7I6W0_9CLOT|nr:CBS domain-containing protein [Youngiibacter fragilis]ETA80954.1 inosine-5-monophosphate dehydrogenase [Youngiibacter fragilis 232.1]
MNIAFFLTPKSEIIYENTESTMRQVLERMEHHSYTAIPILDRDGKYIGTLTEGDLLWKIKNTPGLSFRNTNKVLVRDIERRKVHEVVTINADIDSIIGLARNQNFVPVVDDEGVFIGIIKRSDIIDYCYTFINEKKKIG